MTYRGRVMAMMLAALVVFAALPVVNLWTARHVGKALNFDLAVLWTLDGAEGWAAYAMIACCGRSYKPRLVTVGADGYLFLTETTRQPPAQTPAQAPDVWLAQVAGMRAQAKAVGAQFLMAFAPNKLTVYPEALPGVGPFMGTDATVAAAAAMGLPVVDMRAVLIAAKADRQVYFRTDTHWTAAGAAIGYRQIMDSLNAQFGLNLIPLVPGARPVAHPAGDLARMLKMVDILGPAHEVDYAFDLASPVICQSEFGGGTADCTGTGMIEMGKTTVVTRADTAPNPQTVLMICDSFCYAHSGLFNATFKTVYRAHVQFLTPEALQQVLDAARPDIVVMQVVERNMRLP